MNFAPAAERSWRDAWPLVARTDDGNAWVTGDCWLYCRREGVRVLWIGSVHTPGATGELYACGPCVAELDHMVRTQSHVRDAPTGTRTRKKAKAGNKTEACEHRQTEKRAGKTHCRICERQLYL